MIYEVHMNYYSSFLSCVMALYGYPSISVAQPAYIDSVAISHTVSFMTEDIVWVFSDLYPAKTGGEIKQMPVILLLHQSASNSRPDRKTGTGCGRAFFFSGANFCQEGA